MSFLELNKLRKRDLEVLLQIRKNSHYVWNEDIKRQFLFIYAISSSHLSEEELKKEIYNINLSIRSKSFNFMKRLYARIPSFCRYFALTGCNRYKYSTLKIIQELNITDFEENELLVLNSKAAIIKDEEELQQELNRQRIEREIDKSIKAQNEKIIFLD